MAWLVFIGTATAIVLAGTVLARQATVISARTGIGEAMIGAFLLAGITSLPELVTDTAAIVRDVPELATGDLFGSNMANMAILGLLGVFYARRRVLQREALGIALTASTAIIMTGIAVLFIVARLEIELGWLSLGTLALVAVVLTRSLIPPDLREPAFEPVDLATLPPLRPAIAWFLAAAAVVVAAGPFLVWSAEQIAEITGLGNTFFGVLGLAVATSLPELATSGAAVRLGALDLAVGNLFGSNIANMTILAWLDVIHTDGPLLEGLDPSNAVAGIVAMLLMTVGLMAMVLRTERRPLPVDLPAAGLLAGYGVGLLMVWSVAS